MEFLDKYVKSILEPLRNEMIKLENKQLRHKFLMTKKDKTRLDKITKIYYEKLEWYEKMLEL